MGELLASMKRVTKKYGSIVAADIESFEVYEGKIYALIGSNGSGKTTMMKILSGLESCDSGVVELTYDNKTYMIHHETSLFQELRVYENMFMNDEPKIGIKKLGVVDWKKIRERTQHILHEYEIDIDIDTKVKYLSVASQKIIEIVVALAMESKIIIIDEPLALLDKNEIEIINRLIKKIKKRNITVIYISHRMDEILEIADHITVLNKGKIIQDDVKEKYDKGQLIKYMVGIKKRERYPKRNIRIGREMLRVENISTNVISDINFDVKEGEILGITGLRGSHKSSIGLALFGVMDYNGNIYIDGKKVKVNSTHQAVTNGICYIGDKNEGVFFDNSIYENITSANIKKVRALNRSSKKLITGHYVEMLNITPKDISVRLKYLSAGNKKKVMLSKWLFSNSKIFIFNKPTANIDTASKIDIYNIFMDLVSSGAAIIMITNDFDELIGMSDRILVMDQGKMVADIEGYDASEEKIMRYIASNNDR
ncbi:ribose ABC transporter ATP-binding protein [Vallitalea longa]|uniref:Ribose ABC transporter ATP-binding protein n=1 Tax=Vallitalea longa TaxID=2936439 RepID=A0A9W5Y831_9FIRM|nr:sugar ABC transporter ATP-binding protein [Vallitalea longa]GKX28154.1 ribose ABC transporter ATP-binding protein [Vallitalea longa]